MGSTQFGNFHNFCRDSTLPVCNIFHDSRTRGGSGFGRCNLNGISLGNGRHLENLGSILFCGLAILISIFLLWRANRKQAAVGRREFQLFLVGYIIVSICEIFTVGGFPLKSNVRLGFTAVHLGAIVATIWVLFLNGIVGYQILDDGTPLSLGLILVSAAALFIGTGYIALDTGFDYTRHFDPSLDPPDNRNIGLYVLYQLAPLVFLVGFFLLETFLVLRVLGERKPMLYLFASALLFAIGQIFQRTLFDMAESDEEYVQDISDDEVEAHQVTRGTGVGTRATGQGKKGGGWEVTRTWENVVEGADGTISSTVDGLLEAGKRKRLLKDTTPLQRGIIRHLILIIDLSSAMIEKDLRPTRYLLTLRYCQEFVTEFFEQNPISQLGIIGMRDGLAVRVSDMSGNPSDHIGKLQALRDQEPKGNPSLQNALDMARAALFHAPAHGTREILLLFGSLISSDPSDIHTSIAALVSSSITTTVIGLAAQVAVCTTLVKRTNPSLPLSETYNVALNEVHYRDLLMRATTPPATSATDAEAASKSSLLMMGFPSRITDPAPTLCACHSKPTRGGYFCSRCSSKVCALPTTCPACGLTLILSTHLARSYHHLFPLRNWREVSWSRAEASPEQSACFGCLTPFPVKPPPPPLPEEEDDAPRGREHDQGNRRKASLNKKNPLPVLVKPNPNKDAGVSESGRYECETCGRFFCIDCDVFAHEVVHNCPGCQSREGELLAAGPGGEREGPREGESGSAAVNGNGVNGHGTIGNGDAMDVDGS